MLKMIDAMEANIAMSINHQNSEGTSPEMASAEPCCMGISRLQAELKSVIWNRFWFFLTLFFMSARSRWLENDVAIVKI